MGICAGGFLAGRASYNSLNLTGVRFGFYTEVNKGIHKTAVAIASVGVPAIEQYWEDGPQFTGWGSIVGKYPDGTPAIVEGRSGNGWVILLRRSSGGTNELAARNELHDSRKCREYLRRNPNRRGIKPNVAPALLMNQLRCKH